MTLIEISISGEEDLFSKITEIFFQKSPLDLIIITSAVLRSGEVKDACQPTEYLLPHLDMLLKLYLNHQMEFIEKKYHLTTTLKTCLFIFMNQ